MRTQSSSIRSALRKILPFLLQGKEQSLKEADTVQRVVKVFEDVFGYDGMTEITRESLIKGKYVDLAIKIGETTKLLVEIKAAGSPLRDRHTDQARSYAAEANVPWVVLTNATTWQLYHLTFEEGIEHDRVFEVELTEEPADDCLEMLGLLTRESIQKGNHENYWRKKSALNPTSLGRALFTESIIRMLRREIRRSQNVAIDEEDLAAALKELFSVEAREAMGPVKVRRRRRKPEQPPEAIQKPGPPASSGNEGGQTN